MRRIDAIGITIGFFVTGGLLYIVLQVAGLDSLSAGVWSQFILVGGLIGWLLSYLFRVVTQTMTYNQQLKDYKETVLQKRLEEMTPEELAEFQTSLAEENPVKTAESSVENS